MGVQNFSEMQVSGLVNLNSRVTAAIQLSRIFAKLTEVERFFGIIPANSVSTRVSVSLENFDSYKKHFQEQFDQYEPARAHLVLVVQGLLQAVQAKANELAGLNASIAAAVGATSGFDSLWRELLVINPC